MATRLDQPVNLALPKGMLLVVFGSKVRSKALWQRCSRQIMQSFCRNGSITSSQTARADKMTATLFLAND